MFADIPTEQQGGEDDDDKKSSPDASYGRSTDALRSRQHDALLAYQEWSLAMLEKAALGRSRRVDIIFGVDKSSVYTAKPDRPVASAAGASSPVRRDIATISSIEAVGGDPKSFRINWKSAGLSEVTVFQCSDSKDAVDILHKIRGILELISS